MIDRHTQTDMDLGLEKVGWIFYRIKVQKHTKPTNTNIVYYNNCFVVFRW